MSYWEVDGYCSALESMGYTKAYDVEKYKKELDEDEEEYNWAAKRYSMAKENPLVKRKQNEGSIGKSEVNYGKFK